MPQMAPLSWLSLYIMFSLALILFAALNYFIFFYEAPKSSSLSTNTTTPLSWQW